MPARCFEDYVEASLIHIARYAAGDARVVCALLDAVADVAETAAAAGAYERVAVLSTAAARIAHRGREHANSDERDREDIDRRHERLEQLVAADVLR